MQDQYIPLPSRQSFGADLTESPTEGTLPEHVGRRRINDPDDCIPSPPHLSDSREPTSAE